MLSVKDPTSTCGFCVVRASKTVHDDDDDAKKWSGCIWLQLYSTWDVTLDLQYSDVAEHHATCSAPSLAVASSPRSVSLSFAVCRSYSFVAFVLAYWMASGYPGGSRFESCSQRSLSRKSAVWSSVGSHHSDSQR